MQKIWSTRFQEGFEKAFHEMKEDYQRTPFIYMNKWDVVSDLYSRLKGLSKNVPIETGRFTMGKDGRWRQKKTETGSVVTSPLHLQIGSSKDEKAKADLCFIDLSTLQIAVTARFSKKKPTSLASWRFETGLGISVVMNTDVQYSKRKNMQTGRTSKTEGLKELEKEALRVMTDLKEWDRSILLFLDHHGIYTKLELESAFSRKLNPYTQKMYYLSPKSGFFITGRRKGEEQ